MRTFMTDTTGGSGGVAEALGRVSALVGMIALGTWLLVSGLRRRGATGGAKGTVRVVLGALVLAFVVLGSLGNLAQQT
ncbi:hypothetical protein [Aeromicrobium endophyticum]|uniref:Uncharacterized protein n=1 Tax=Aeromicrobium endophyticum TaxID=2292704 RepID=A0A371PC72_9ACTN|nr:hypothetical protein [Aeromicrobium endophyticum]REK73549.1 hypothetical protein DX116_08400 [Aeromicrobium endophyticum]